MVGQQLSLLSGQDRGLLLHHAGVHRGQDRVAAEHLKGHLVRGLGHATAMALRTVRLIQRGRIARRCHVDILAGVPGTASHEQRYQ